MGLWIASKGCKSCGKTYCVGDLREKYTNEKRLQVIKWYLKDAGIMWIERMESVPNPLIIKWVHRFSIVRRKFPMMPKIFKFWSWMNFLATVKNSSKSTYSLLLIGSEIKWLTLKWRNHENSAPSFHWHSGWKRAIS